MYWQLNFSNVDDLHQEHLARIKANFLDLVDTKYRQGQAEHGGQLWTKPGLLDEAINEVVDLAVYLLTLKEQINDLKKEYEP